MRVSAFAAGDQQPDLAFFKRNVLGHAEEQQGVGSFTCTFLGHFKTPADGRGGGRRRPDHAVGQSSLFPP